MGITVAGRTGTHGPFDMKVLVLTKLMSQIYHSDIRLMRATAVQMRTSLRLTGLVGLLAAAALPAAGCGSGQPQPTTSAFAGAAPPSGTWAYPNGDLANTRDASGSVISAANVSSLREAWSFHLTGTAAAGVRGAGSFAANPVVVGGTVYLQDLDANVYAIALATGKLRWQYQVNVPEATGPGPDGVAVS